MLLLLTATVIQQKMTQSTNSRNNSLTMKIVPNTTIWIWEEPLENVYIRATKVPTYMYHDFQSDCVDLSICSTHIMFPFGIPWSILARSHLIVSAGIILITSLLFLNRRSELLISFLSTKLLLFKNWYFPFSHFHVFQQCKFYTGQTSEKKCKGVLFLFFHIPQRRFIKQSLSFSITRLSCVQLFPLSPILISFIS